MCICANGQNNSTKLEGVLDSHKRLGKMALKQLKNITLDICPHPVSSLSCGTFPHIGMEHLRFSF